MIEWIQDGLGTLGQAGGPYYVYAQTWEWQGGIWVSVEAQMFDSFEAWKLGYPPDRDQWGPAPPYQAYVVWRWITDTIVANGLAKSPAKRWEKITAMQNW